MPQHIHVSLSDVGTSFVFHAFQFEFRQACMELQGFIGVYCTGEVCVGWYPYVCSYGNVLDFTAYKVKTEIKTNKTFQEKVQVGDISVKCKPE